MCIIITPCRKSPDLFLSTTVSMQSCRSVSIELLIQLIIEMLCLGIATAVLIAVNSSETCRHTLQPQSSQQQLVVPSHILTRFLYLPFMPCVSVSRGVLLSPVNASSALTRLAPSPTRMYPLTKHAFHICSDSILFHNPLMPKFNLALVFSRPYVAFLAWGPQAIS